MPGFEFHATSHSAEFGSKQSKIRRTRTTHPSDSRFAFENLAEGSFCVNLLTLRRLGNYTEAEYRPVFLGAKLRIE